MLQVVDGNADDNVEDDATLSKEECHGKQSFLFGGFGAAMDVEVSTCVHRICCKISLYLPPTPLRPFLVVC